MEFFMKHEIVTQPTELVGGIEVITDKILADAEADKAAILAKAEEEAKAILSGYEEKANAIRKAAEERAAKEREVSRERAASAAANHGRNLLLKQKGALVEAAFDSALQTLEALEDGEYLKLLSGLLHHTLAEYLASEALTASYEGEDFVKEKALSLVMAKRDARFAKSLADSVKSVLNDADKTLTVGESDDKMRSGFALVAGDIRIDCSLATLIASQKGALEGEVYRTLFG